MSRAITTPRPYVYRDESPGLRSWHYLGLSLIVALLAWKLLRGIAPGPLTWYLHLAAMLALAAASVVALGRNHFRLRTFDLSAVVFVFSVLVVVRTVAFGNYNDPFTVAGFVFFSHLYLTQAFTRVSDRSFFRGLSFVLGGLAVVEILGIVEYVSGWGVVDYAAMEAMEGVAPIEGVYAGQSFILYFLDLEFLQQFVGRLSGVGGTPYATGGLMAAIAAFGLASGRKSLVILAVTALLLSSTGSAFLALFLSAAIMFRKRPLMYVPLLLTLPFLVWIFDVKGLDEQATLTEIYFDLEITGSLFHMFAATILGEGRHTSSIHTEFRILGLMLSLGLTGLACVGLMWEGWMRGVGLPASPETRREYRAAGYFVLALLISTVHYPTLFIYPNIAIVVAFLALISSRLRLTHVADSAPTAQTVEV